MKLRFRKNSLRLRVNRREAERLSSGAILEEEIRFPENARISYVLKTSSDPSPGVCFQDGVICVTAPEALVRDWAGGNSVGIYFELPADGAVLQVAIEKDLECIDIPAEERDPDAFLRSEGKNC